MLAFMMTTKEFLCQCFPLWGTINTDLKGWGWRRSVKWSGSHKRRGSGDEEGMKVRASGPFGRETKGEIGRSGWRCHALTMEDDLRLVTSILAPLGQRGQDSVWSVPPQQLRKQEDKWMCMALLTAWIALSDTWMKWRPRLQRGSSSSAAWPIQLWELPPRPCAHPHEPLTDFHVSQDGHCH